LPSLVEYDHPAAMIVHIVDGNYELFRHFYGQRRFNKGNDAPLGAAVGVLQSELEIVEQGEPYIGVATDRVVESFRNALWPGYKTSAGIKPALLAQFLPLEDALVAMGVVVWPMVELEADDAMALAAWLASRDKSVEKVCLWTPDKDIGAVGAARLLNRHARPRIPRPTCSATASRRHCSSRGWQRCAPTRSCSGT
jgi:5'-3' exonuclease